VATNIGRGTAVLYQVYLLTGRKSKIAVTRETLGIDSPSWTRASNVRFRHLADPHFDGQLRRHRADHLHVRGAFRLAGYTIGIRIIMFALLPSSV